MQYAFLYRLNQPQLDSTPIRFLSIDERFTRMGLDASKWRVSTVNANYELTEFLPERLIVPQSVGDSRLKSLSEFRSNGRLPHVTYHHARTGAILARSSEPQMGPKGKRSIDDEDYVQLLLRSTSSSLPAIVDLRTKSTVALQRNRGGGTESDGSYPNIRMFFTNIDSPPGIREAYSRFVEGKF